MKLTWNDSWILVLLDVGLLGAMPQGVRVVLLHSVVELDLRSFQIVERVFSISS